METGRRGTGSAIGEPEQSSPPDHPFRPACAPELLCGVAVVITEQARPITYDCEHDSGYCQVEVSSSKQAAR